MVHSSSVSIRTDIPDAHVTRWPSGRARSRPPSAPLIRKGRAAERTSVPAIRQRVARSTSDLHGRTRHRVARAPIKIRRSSDHHSANARDTRSCAGCRKDRAFSIGSDFLQDPLVKVVAGGVLWLLDIGYCVACEQGTCSIVGFLASYFCQFEQNQQWSSV